MNDEINERIWLGLKKNKLKVEKIENRFNE